MATLERSWTSSLNNVFTPVSSVDLSRRILWSLKALLKGELGGLTAGLWTHFGSSDGVTAGLDATDRWTNAYDGTKIVRAAAGTAHSWIILKSPVMADGNNWYFTIDFVGTLDTSARFVWSKTAPTGGTTLNRPTSVDEFTSVKTAQTVLHDATFATNYRTHMGLSSTGDFWFGVGKVGAGFLHFGLITSMLADAPAGDSYSLWAWANHKATTPGSLLNTSVSCALAGASGAANVMQRRAGEGVVPAPIVSPQIAGADYGAAQQLFDANSLPDAYDVTNFKHLDWPCHVFSLSTGLANYGYRGRLVDFRFGAALQATVEPPGGTYTSVLLGTLWLPLGASAVVPLL